MSTYKKYVDIFAQRKSGRRDLSDDRTVMGDKQTYIAFLENQLEKVSGSLTQVASLTETTEQLKLQVEDIDTKLANATRLLKLLQSFADAQEEDNTRINQRLKYLADRMENAQEIQNMKRASDPIREERPDSLASKCNELERKFNSLVEHIDTMRATSMNEQHFHSGPPFNFESQDIQRQLQEFENRMMKQLNAKFEEHNKKLKTFEAKTEEAHEKLTRDMAMDIRTLEGRMTDFLSRGGRDSLVPTQRSTNEFQNQMVTKAVNTLKDDLYHKIEGVLNEVSNSVTLKEFDEFKEKVNKQIAHLKQATNETEKICLRSEKLAGEFNEEIVSRISKFESKLFELEFAQTSEISRQKQDYEQLFKRVQTEMAEHEKALRRTASRVEKYPSMQTEGQESENEKRDYNKVTRKDFDDFEDRLSDKISGSLEKFTEVIQKIMKRQREFEIALEKINTKVARIDVPGDTARTHGNQSTSFIANPSYYSELSADVGKPRGNQSFASDKSGKTITKPAKDHFVLIKSPKQALSVDKSAQKDKELQASFGLREVPKPTKDRSFASNKSRENQDRLSETTPSVSYLKQRESVPRRHYQVDEDLFEKKPESKTRKPKSKAKSRSRSASRSPVASEATPKGRASENYFKATKSPRAKTKSLKKAKSKSPPTELKLKEPYLKRVKSVSRSVSPRNLPERLPRQRKDSLRGESSVYSSKKDTLKDIENRVHVERRLREEKIKTLLRKNKKRDAESPKFSFDYEQRPTKQGTVKSKKTVNQRKP